MKQAPSLHISTEEYLTRELTSPLRHEYVAGTIHAMAGAGRRHNLIAGNISSRLRQAARGGPCRVFISGMKVRVPAGDAFYYPDVAAACDPADTQEFYLEAPCLIVEVLSPATEAIDRREKLHAYRTLPRLTEYVLVSQEARHIEIHRREPAGDWILILLEENDPVELRCLDVTLTMDEVYEDAL
ncbi:MAG: Uma2 family endonuclease [Gammaproteobacteria bacterium]|nr:Uma2 family endonuclease [Gammaproteobacteria bacterium]